MWQRRPGLGPRERRDTLVAVAALFTIMVGHSLLETARDSLFLASLPATSLPWAYLAIALLALGVIRFNRFLLEHVSRRRALSITLAAGAAVTIGFWMAGGVFAYDLVALYVWTGLLATVTTIQFWLLLGTLFDFSQAKRVFGLVASGGLAGAAVGGLGARVALHWIPSLALLVLAAGAFAIGAAWPALLSDGTRLPGPAESSNDDISQWETIKNLPSSPYLLGLLLLTLMGAATVTGIDFVFKAVVSSRVPRSDLGMFFGSFYGVLNAIALLLQLLLAPRLLRGIGVQRTLWVMPLLLFLGAGAFLVTGSLYAALALKGSDGALRHSIQRTTMEILYLPLDPADRSRLRSLGETLGQRGGQALASIGILGALSLGAGVTALTVGIAVLSWTWLAVVAFLHPHYLELFKQQLRHGFFETNGAVPELDLSTLEVLVGTLSSGDDAEVIAALEMFEAYGRSQLIPALILFHPSREVVLTAFRIFMGAHRTDVERLAARLLRHPDHELRSAAMRYYASAEPSRETLQLGLDDESPAVRATAMAGMLAAGFVDAPTARQRLQSYIDGDSAEALRAVALSCGLLPPQEAVWISGQLLGRHERDLDKLTANALASAPRVEHLPVLIELLASLEGRGPARSALRRLGSPALEALQQAFGDPGRRRDIRRHLPRTISCFGTQAAVDVLMQQLQRELDESVAFKILRGLGRLRADDATLFVERAPLIELASAQLREGIDALSWRLAIENACQSNPSARTPSGELLVALLRDREAAAIERIFRLLHIAEPAQEYDMIHDGLKSTDPRIRAASLELLEHIVPDELRVGLLPLVEGGEPSIRLGAATQWSSPPGSPQLEQLGERPVRGEDLAEPLGRQDLDAACVAALTAMLRHPNSVVCSIASYHIAELGVSELREEAERVSRGASTAWGEMAERAFQLLGRRSEVEGA